MNRWTDSAPAEGTPEARAAELVQKMGEPELPSDERMAAIRSRIVLRRGSRRARRSLTWALVTAALLVGATLGAAARGWIEPLLSPLRARPERDARPTSPLPPAARRARPSGLAAASPPAPVAESPVPVAAPSIEPPAVTAPSRAGEDPSKSRARPAQLGEPVRSLQPSSGASEEARLLGVAIRRLRRDRDARGALAALDEGARTFPRGELAAEAELVRVEALLAMDDRATALRLLDGRELAAGPRARQALQLRGELRAEAGRCTEAVADLERAIGPSSDDSLAERGLFARASCLTRLHQYPAARRDLEAYLLRFPNGPRAAAATEALGSLPGAK